MTHILLDDDAAAKQQMLLELLAEAEPRVLEQAARAATARIGRVGYLPDVRGEFMARSYDGATETRRAEAQEKLTRGEYRAALALAREAQTAARTAYALAQPTRNRELRAVWEHSGAGPHGDWERSMTVLEQNGFNAIFVNMLWGGKAHYPSDFLPASDLLREKGDQVAACVAAAKRHGIEVHVWKVNWNLSGAPKDFVAKLRADGRTMVSAAGKPVDWLCPSHPANQQLERDAMLEVAAKYDIQGLHFDYIRYLDASVCYCPGCRARFEAQLGRPVANWPGDAAGGALKDSYRRWRCDQITKLVKAVALDARKLKPGLKLSAAVFSNLEQAREEVGQDWLAWCREGYLDFVCPMDYIAGENRFVRTVRTQARLLDGRRPFMAGIGVSAGSSSLDAEQVMAQMQAAREAGAQGFVLFDYSDRLANEVLPALRLGATRERAELPWK